jgi:hypothetical protein
MRGPSKGVYDFKIQEIMKQSVQGSPVCAKKPNKYAPVAARPDFAPNCDLPRHRWYRFKEGFSAGLVESFVQEHLPNKRKGRMLDPFLGSGTTALEGARLGHQVDGLETNPFMVFMAKVKTRDYSSFANIEHVALECFKNTLRQKAFALPNDTTLVERKGLKKWLLNKSVASRFEQLRTAIQRIVPATVRDLLLLALMSSVEDVANARKDGKCWRYKTNWQHLAFDGVALDNAFAAQVIRFVEDIKLCPNLKGSANVTRADARNFQHEKTALFDGVLTSPPYLNSFDYTDIYRPELLLMHKARDSFELRKLRLSTVRSHVQIKWKTSPALGVPLLQRKVRDLDSAGLWNSRIPEMINAYFVDLDQVVGRCAQRLRSGATAAFVVADSAYAGVVIPVGLILAEILERRGFNVEETALFRKTLGNGNHQSRSSELLKEVMVVARYQPSSRRKGVVE